MRKRLKTFIALGAVIIMCDRYGARSREIERVDPATKREER
ncbi:MAG: hypothetical protein ACJAUG_003101 [Halioglobus sp.]|jgi:hypothetical protein